LSKRARAAEDSQESKNYQNKIQPNMDVWEKGGKSLHSSGIVDIELVEVLEAPSIGSRRMGKDAQAAVREMRC